MRKIDKAYEFIKNYIDEKTYPPTIREIGEAIGVRSTSTVSYYLRRLEEENKIVKGSYKNRSIQLISSLQSQEDNTTLLVMPCVTNITTGKPLMSEQNISNRYTLSASLFKGLDMFMMPVKDNTMQDSSILKGDIVIVSRQNVARNGEIVVAMVGSSYMIARLFKEFKLFKLQFDNEKFDPIYAEKLTILGKVVGVIRNEIE